MRWSGITGRLRDRDVQWGAALGALALVLYLLTLCPTVYWYDSAEFAAHAVALGVPHPPGYPLYTMIAHVFTWLPGEAAFDVNLMSAVFGAADVVLLFVMARRFDVGRPGAAVGALTLATGATFWANAVVSEVYTPGLFFTLGTFALLQQGLATARPRLMIAAALVGGLGVGMHMSIATCGLGYVFLVLSYGIPLRKWSDVLDLLKARWGARLPLLALCAVATAVGLLVFLYIPWRNFPDKLGDPTQWVIFRKNATGGTFKRKFLQDYDFDERFGMTLDILLDNLHVVGLGLIAVGIVVALRRDPRLGVGLLLGAAGNLYWFFNYSVPDLDVFYLPAMAIGCLLLGMAVDALAAFAARRRHVLRRLQWLAFALPVSFVIRNYARVDLSHEVDAAQWGEAACRGIPKGATIVMYSLPDEWRLYSVFIYVQDALGQCRDVRIVKKPGTDRIYAMMAQGIPVYAFLPKRQFRIFGIEPDGVLYRLSPHREPGQHPRPPRRRSTSAPPRRLGPA